MVSFLGRILEGGSDMKNKKIEEKLRDELKNSKCSECGEPIPNHKGFENFLFGEVLICPNKEKQGDGRKGN